MIDLEAVRKLEVQDGNLLVVPHATEHRDMERLGEALRLIDPDLRVIIMRGPVEQLDAAAMNRLGWYRG